MIIADGKWKRKSDPGRLLFTGSVRYTISTVKNYRKSIQYEEVGERPAFSHYREKSFRKKGPVFLDRGIQVCRL